MKKIRGITLAAALSSGFLLHPSPKTPAPAVQERTLAVSSTSQGKAGPWEASCKYWKAGRTEDTESASAPTPQEQLKVSLTERNEKQSSTVTVMPKESDSVCDSAHWNIPTAVAGHSRITALIATIPDPVHTSRALETDRTVDVFTQAASAYSYVASYYWLPWKAPQAQAEGLTAQNAGLQEAAEPSSEPGLIIFKKSCSIPSESKPDCPPDSSTGADQPLLYLFVVSNGPALGVDGEQLRRALRYEQMLMEKYKAKLSFKCLSADPCMEADVIGPNHSGAAASLSAGLDASTLPKNMLITAAGNTSTKAAVDSFASTGKHRMSYLSFYDDAAFDQKELETSLEGGGREDLGRFAFLVESGTVLGAATLVSEGPLYVSFPRGISMLRNAEDDNKAASDVLGEGVTSPYLHLSLKEPGVEDTVAHYAPILVPYSHEAVWTSISRELERRHANVVAIQASNVLDELFLAKLVRRDLPNARVVLHNSDLLFARRADNASYVGDLAFTAYPLTDISRSFQGNRQLDAFTNSSNEALYNAAVYTFWDGVSSAKLKLADYSNPFVDGPGAITHPPMWANAIGRDGYYLLGMVAGQSSNQLSILSEMPAKPGEPALQPETNQPATGELAPTPFNVDVETYPALSWYLLCFSVSGLCVLHGIAVLTASFWSPLSRDLAIEVSDEPRRRAVSMNIAAVSLFCTGFVTGFPAWAARHLIDAGPATLASATITMAAGVFALVATDRKTRQYSAFFAGNETTAGDTAFYRWFNVVAFLTAIVIPVVWVLICTTNKIEGGGFYVGLFFSHRCLYPASGVCPLIPAVLILLTWYLWALLQTKRLRFSCNSRPKLPNRVALSSIGPVYVADDDLSRCAAAVDSCLYSNITSLLITRELILRQAKRKFTSWAQQVPWYFNPLVGLLYLALFIVFVLKLHIEGLDRFLHPGYWFPTPYEFLISAIFYPLLVVALTGCIRMIVIWFSLCRGLLDPLERSPMRFAFSRLTNVTWVTMLRQSGLLEYWQDMSRVTESMQQLCHVLSEPERASALLEEHQTHINQILQTASGQGPAVPTASPNYLTGVDVPDSTHSAALDLLCAIERDYALFGEMLLLDPLDAYWQQKRDQPVEGEVEVSTPEANEKATKPLGGAPPEIVLAEEFLAVRYLSVIRAVLINLRLLMTFISVAFVLAILAWNSYPFQPRQWVDWAFTFLLFGVGSAVVWVFAQMHRNPILSRITGTKANELGADFFIRLLTFGAAPLITWLSSQFPEIGNQIFRLFQSGMELTK